MSQNGRIKRSNRDKETKAINICRIYTEGLKNFDNPKSTKIDRSGQSEQKSHLPFCKKFAIFIELVIN